MQAAYRFVVVGGGPCGGLAASELARASGAGTVAMIGEEASGPYERPVLSKSFLTDEAEPPLPEIVTQKKLEELGIRTIYSDPAISINCVNSTVRTESGQQISYEKLLIATGARPRVLDIPGADLKGVHLLRSYADAKSLRAGLRTAKQLVVIGGGLIGLEVAAAAQSLGLSVTVIEAGERVMGRICPSIIAEAVLGKFTANSVDVRLGWRPIRIDEMGQSKRVAFDNGEVIEADLVAIGIGSRPNTILAETSGIAVQDGVLVDHYGQTSVENVYAAGDVANRPFDTFGVRRRLEAWDPALEHGRLIAAAMLGQKAARPRAPWAWTDLFDWNIQFLGFGDLADTEIVVSGRPEARELVVLQARAGKLVGATALNAGRDMAYCRRALARGASVDFGAARAERRALQDILVS